MTSRLLPLAVPFLLVLLSCGEDAHPAKEGAGSRGHGMQGQHAPVPVQNFFQKGDRVAIIGNGLADRLQHDGWMETYLQAELAGQDVAFRNHGYTGDRIDHRPRNKGFMAADDYLALSRASVVFAMFGYNASFDGDPEGFQKAVEAWVEHTRSQNYSGQGAPRIVLFSPIAAQDLRDGNLPDPDLQNQQLAAYAAAMETAAKNTGVRFVDLFTPSLHHFSMAGSERLTIDGVHLNEPGNRMLGQLVSSALYGGVTRLPETDLQTLRALVLDKNWHWFNRYRATDGNDVWGSRAGLKFVNGQDNGTVLQHELVQLDVTTANRDRVIWARLAGEDLEPDDSNVPAPIEVLTNLDKPQEQGGISKIGDGTYLGADEAMDRMTLAQGLKANVFASEEMFPAMVNPVQLGVGPKGRLWAAAWATYPKWEPLKEMNDRLLILPDENGDGVADRAITFAKVHNPTGFEFWNGGVLVASAPEILFLKDTDGDDVADVRISLLGGIDSADTHHAMNNFVMGPDGFLYYQRGVFHVSNVESPWQTNQQSGTSGMYRFNPRTFEFSFHATNSPNPHGISFDYWGYHYATDGTGGACWQVMPDEDGRFKMRKLLKHTVRPVASSGILSSDHFPEEFQGDFLLCNTIAFLGLKQYGLEFDTITGEASGTEKEDFLVSTDPNFRPTDFEIGSDGAMYVSDWCNAIIGHMQHNVRDPSRDKSHGRIYRVIAEGRPLSKPVAVAGLELPELLNLLEHPINGVRHRVRSELSGRDTTAVIAATEQWLESFDIRKPEDAHHLLEGLWVYQQHNVLNRDLLKKLLNSPEAHARLAAQRVQYMWDHNKSTPGPAPVDEPANATPTPPEGAIVLRTVIEEMKYDVESFTVAAGSPVKLWFYNPDYMPHNLVIGQPGSADSIGPAAESMGADGFNKAFVPKHDQIIAASALLMHKESELLEFTAPTQPGHYDFLCTFPGHWKRMRGTMIVD